MTDINLKTLTPDTSLPTTGFLFGADSQASTNPSVYSTQTVATTLLGSTSLTGDTLTADAPVLNLAQTWNSVGTTFTGIKFNAAGTSDANSAAASLLMDLQVNTSSKLGVQKSGKITGSTSANLFSINAVNINDTLIGSVAAGFCNNFLINGGNTGVGFAIGSNFPLSWSTAFNQSNYANLNTVDLFLTRRGTANLRLGAFDTASPVAQTFSVQSVVAGTSNTAGANFTITGSQGTGSGVGGSIIFQVAPVVGNAATVQNALSTALTIASTGVVTAPLGNLAVSNGSVLVSSGGFGGGVNFVSAGWITNANVNVIGIYNQAKTDAPLIALGGLTSSFPALKRSSTALQARLADDSAFASVQGKLTTDTAYTAGALVATGYITLYDSTGTAYRVPCLV
jgi:hypothetical protein